MQTPLLALVAKTPVPGRVKTRFCPPLTLEKAADLYRACLLDALDLLVSVPGVTPGVVLPPDADEAALAGLLPPGLWIRRQERAGLTDALGGTVAAGLGAGHSGVVIFGSDIPSLPRFYLEQAVASLVSHDAVIGPTTDGGYYLIGLNRPEPRLFADMTWSTAAVFAETVARARCIGLRLACLPPWYDIDEPADLDFLAAHLAADPTIPAVATRRLLRSSHWNRAVRPSEAGRPIGGRA